MSGFLEQMAATSAARVRRAKASVAEATLLERAQRTPAPPPLRLAADGFDLIAELKLRSPAAGALGAADASMAAYVTAYAHAGAAAVSVLTEPTRFDGALTHLSDAARALAPHRVPAMRKDFLVDPYQVLEARVAGAGGVLLILRMLSRETLGALIECARSQGLFVLLEAFDAADLERMHEVVAADAGRSTLLAGVNCRDLATLEVVPGRLLELAPLLPGGVPPVAESGVAGAEDARRLAAAGYRLLLVGSALMRDQDPAGLARALIETGRAARRTS
ncbi:MAG TPA: indole-3-glycerol-phosphate synthase [Steroidobacteraceae bacterium]|nr:indole-3-glycerol-phosphate synthase [Steroidobacteraceae bacterium]